MAFEIVGALAGGVAGGFFAVAAVFVQGYITRRDQKRNDKRALIAVLQAIQDEVETVWDRYMQTAGGTMSNLASNTPFLTYYPVGFDYFSIFHGNAFLIGRIDNAVLRKLIVQTYTHAKGLVDSYRMNNVMVEKFQQTSLLAAQQQVYQAQRQVEFTVLVQYAQIMKASHDRVGNLVDRLVSALRGEIQRLSGAR